VNASSWPSLSTKGVKFSMSQKRTVTCFRSPSILPLWARIFSVSPPGRYFWIFVSFSSNESSVEIGSGETARARPHPPQNSSSGRFSNLHSGQSSKSFFPHLRQNFLLSGFSTWHFGHFMCCSLKLELLFYKSNSFIKFFPEFFIDLFPVLSPVGIKKSSQAPKEAAPSG